MHNHLFEIPRTRNRLRFRLCEITSQRISFRFQARPDDITNLYKEINKRIDLEKSRTPTSSTRTDDVTNEKLPVEK